MNYYKDPNTSNVYAYDDEQVSAGLAGGKTPMTQAEVEVHLNPPPPAPLTIDDYRNAIQAHMDSAARSAGYDDIKTAVTYADEPAVPKFQNEGRAFRVWRSLCWAYAYTQLDAVEAGEREQPTVEQLVAELPELELPV